ncbi:MAG: chemotaxis protein CheX [Proteobacteria bacterium]|nr:chemotaxis protein CheX [Pseudomonadota bacterium]
MGGSAPAELQSLVKVCVEEFLSANPGLTEYRLTYADAAIGDTIQVSFASVLGYSGDLIKGSLVVSCEKQLLDKSHPNLAMGMPVDESDLLDWVGEMTNQLLGRIKNKISGIGIKFSMSTPTTVTGKSMQIKPDKDGFTIANTYSGPYGDLAIQLLMIADPEVKFESIKSVNVASEGDAMLF